MSKPDWKKITTIWKPEPTSKSGWLYVHPTDDEVEEALAAAYQAGETAMRERAALLAEQLREQEWFEVGPEIRALPVSPEEDQESAN